MELNEYEPITDEGRFLIDQFKELTTKLAAVEAGANALEDALREANAAVLTLRAERDELQRRLDDCLRYGPTDE